MEEHLKISKLELLKGNSYKLTPFINVKHPTLGEIADFGYVTYCSYMSKIAYGVYDDADILWVEKGVWYEDITEWEYFVSKCISEKSVNILMVDNNNELLKVETGCVIINSGIRDALNFFLFLDGEYAILVEIDEEGKENNLIVNLEYDNDGLYKINPQCFILDESKFNKMFEFLRDINLIKKEKVLESKLTKKGVKKTHLKYSYDERKSKIGKSSVSLDSIVSSLIVKQQNFKELWEYPIYTIYDTYYRMIHIENYNNTVRAYSSGTIDTKKNPIKWDKINWSNKINF